MYVCTFKKSVPNHRGQPEALVVSTFVSIFALEILSGLVKGVHSVLLVEDASINLKSVYPLGKTMQ